MSVNEIVIKQYRRFHTESAKKEDYKDKQLLWDLKQLYFYCAQCEHRINIGCFLKGYQTPSSEYLSSYWTSLKIHNKIIHGLEKEDD